MSRRLLMVAFTVSVAGAVSACGGTTPSTTTAPTTAAVATTTAAADGNAEQFCAVVRQQKALLQGTQLSSLLVGGTPDAWKAYLQQTSAMNQQLVDTAPPEVKASVKTLQDGTLALQTALAAVNYDVSKLGAAQMLALVSTPERKAATTTLVTYVQAHCGLDLTKLDS